jgi:hypothetical protein
MMPVGLQALGNMWLFGLLAPLVVFYFLKLKRPHVRVPSLALWRQVMEDRRVNSPFRRFKRNLLLLLQAALLALLAAAALQPFWRRRPEAARRVAVLVDCSASMGARGEKDGLSRLDAARERVGRMVDSLLPGQETCLVAFSRTARKLGDFTDNKRLLREALGGLKVEDVPADVEDALRLAEGLARGAPLDQVVLFSDGNFRARTAFDLSFPLEYQRLDPAGPNAGITSLNAMRRAEGGWDVFALVEGSAGAEAPLTITVEEDGREVASRRFSLGERKEERVAFHLGGERPSSLVVKLVADGFDALACDNVAYLSLPATRRLSAYAPESLPAFRHALASLDAVSLSKPQAGAPAACDLLVSDREEDLGAAAGTRFYVGLVPADLREVVSVVEGGDWAVDWDRSVSPLEHVELNDVVILDRPVSAAGVREADYERLGYDVLIHGQKGPLVLRKREEGRLSFYLLFHTDRSTLPYRVGFPVLVANVVQAALRQAGLAEAHAVRTGVLEPMRMGPDRACRVEGPDGEVRVQQSDAAGLLCGVPAPRVGVYAVSEPGGKVSRVGASLVDSSETRLAAVEEIQFAEGLAVSASAAQVRTDRPLWPLLAAIGFAVLLAEWWCYQRGMGGGGG